MAEAKCCYTETFKTGLYDIDVAGNPKPSRLTERMLLAANSHLDLLNWSWEHLYKDIGVALVLVEVSLKIKGGMALGEIMKLTTWTSKKLYPMLTRRFAIENGAGETVCEAIMTSVLIDVNTRSITNASKYGLTLLDDDTPPMESSVTRPRFTFNFDGETREPDFRLSKRVLCSDLDYNGHMNTARYVELSEDLPGRDRLAGSKIKEISVRYEKETAYGETIEAEGFEVKGEDGEDRVEIRGRAAGTVRFTARVTFGRPE